MAIVHYYPPYHNGPRRSKLIGLLHAFGNQVTVCRVKLQDTSRYIRASVLGELLKSVVMKGVAPLGVYAFKALCRKDLILEDNPQYFSF